VDHDYSRAYVRHLFIAGEILGPDDRPVSITGIYQWLVKEARNRIEDGTFSPGRLRW
jgi:queuine tRNA-ribosyltransferase